MNAYMTNGTIDFLKKIEGKHPGTQFYFMSGSSNDLAYYEGTKNIFVAGREYEIIIQTGEPHEKGYVVMNHIPVTDEGQSVFEDNFKKRQHTVDQYNGFIAFRLLKPKKGNTYVVFTQWKSKESYEGWKTSSDFQKSHTGIKPPAYFADRPFVNTYTMIEKD
jgi:heme oxygenase (mycobilin-producing)